MEMQKLSEKNFTLAAGILWGGAMFGVGLMNLWWPGYGQGLLDMLASVYPKYTAQRHTMSEVCILGLLAFLNGAFSGFFFAAFHNLFIGKRSRYADGNLSARGCALAMGILWGGAMLGAGLLNLAQPDYGVKFLEMMGTLYTRYYPETRTLSSVFILATLGFLNGVIGGFFFAMVYNFFRVKRSGTIGPPAGQ